MCVKPKARDVDLVQHILCGQQKAFQILVERYESYVFSIILQVVKQREETEEVVQDVFIKVYHQLGRFEQRSQFSTWLYTIAYRTALDHVRKNRISIHSLDEEKNVFQLADDEKYMPSHQVDQIDLANRINTMLNKLKPQDALLIRLYYLRERSITEISDITGMTPSNVKTKLFRLRRHLRIFLSDCFQKEIEDLI